MSILFEPIGINTMVVPNKIMRSATNDRCADTSGRVTDLLIEIYETLAKGGVGLIATGHAYVTKNGKASSTMLGVYHDNLIPGLKKLVNSVHKYDSKIMLQLNHAGRRAISSTIGETPLAPSAFYNSLTKETPREVTEEDIEILIEAFADSARRAVEAGFDAVQIHSSHGYLASQFISPYTNRRDDKWGGSLENRMRFLIEVFRRIRTAVGESYPILIKLNSEDFISDGLSIEESIKIAQVLSDEGIDAIEISGSIPEADLKAIRMNILTEDDEAYFLNNAIKFKKAVSAPLILVGGLRSPHLMERLLKENKIEMVSLCRPFIREPNIVNIWKQGNRKRADCISCGGCHKFRDEPVRCILLDDS